MNEINLDELRKQEEMLAQVRAVLSKILTKEARSRLGNLRAAKPEFATQIELQLFQLYQQGRIPNKITDQDLKEILKQIQKKRNTKIRYM